MRLEIDESSTTFRAYLAAVVGPSRRAFGNSRSVPIQPGESLVVARATGDAVLYVFVGVNNSVGPFVYSKDNSPAQIQNITTAADFAVVMLPGEELNVRQSGNAAANLTVSVVQF